MNGEILYSSVTDEPCVRLFFQVQVWKIVDRTHNLGDAEQNSGDNKETHKFNETPVIFKEIRVCSELDLFTEGTLLLHS